MTLPIANIATKTTSNFISKNSTVNRKLINTEFIPLSYQLNYILKSDPHKYRGPFKNKLQSVNKKYLIANELKPLHLNMPSS